MDTILPYEGFGKEDFKWYMNDDQIATTFRVPFFNPRLTQQALMASRWKDCSSFLTKA